MPSTPAEDRLVDLLVEWEECRARGAEVPVEQLCADCPELLPEVKARIRALESIGALFQTVDWASPGGDSTGLADRDTIAGRYKLQRLLGRGGYATVYEALDEYLLRSVAVKVPRRDRFDSPGRLHQFLREAQTAARLKHRWIVAVHDVGWTEEGICFIVLDYVDGGTLDDALKWRRFAPKASAELLASVAEAVDYANRQGLVHRDLKPSNILLDSHGHAYVSDFGLAVFEESERPDIAAAGTPPFMAPEQIRCENHRLDGRTDVWGLGVILYRMLTGRLPFRKVDGSYRDDILNRDPKPPRQVDSTIPRELERICLRCLAKRMSERYSTAADLAEELRDWIGTCESTSPPSSKPAAPPAPDLPITSRASSLSDVSRPIRIVPKGLRAFGARDADFFLDLVPGPRDRDGLPACLRFWKQFVESPPRGCEAAVGLLYGPSGCGKSSFLKAGLIPRLPENVIVIYIEYVSDDLERDFEARLQRVVPALPKRLPLSKLCGLLRDGKVLEPGEKVLLILDQFEQWLHAHGDEEQGPLLDALRQCDGENFQCIVSIRDDFAMAAARFMGELEIPIIQGANFDTIDRFSPMHARKILSAFGRAFGQLPQAEEELSGQQKRFLEQAIKGLIEDGKVVPVRLALFSEMVKDRPWTPQTLAEVGGAGGIGVAFLEATFAGRSANPNHIGHAPAARRILKALLPETGTDIRGPKVEESRLLEVSGYATKPSLFAELMRTLDSELRLISPVERESEQSPPDRRSSLARPSDQPTPASSPSAVSGCFYQLAHDFLVPSVRDWLTRVQRETRRGRAELLLADQAALWNARPGRKLLPTWSEWLTLRFLTRRSGWSASQSLMMRAAARHHIRRMLLVGVVVITLAAAGRLAQDMSHRQSRRIMVGNLVERLWTIDNAYVSELLDRMETEEVLGESAISAKRSDPAATTQELTRANLALVRSDPSGLDHLRKRLLEAEPAEHRLILHEVRRWKDQITPSIWSVVLDRKLKDEALLRAAAALAEFEPDHPAWDKAADTVAEALVNTDPLLVTPWVDDLRGVRRRLLLPLMSAFADPGLRGSSRLLAASILTDYATSDATLLSNTALVQLLLDGDLAQLRTLMPLASLRKGDLFDPLGAVLTERVPLQSDQKHERRILQQANAAEALLRLGSDTHFWSMLRGSNDPRLRTQLIGRIRLVRSPSTLLDALDSEPNPDVRQAIVLSLADGTTRPDAEQTRIIAGRLVALFEADPDSGVHGAAEWALRQLGYEGALRDAIARLQGAPREGRNWFINKHGHTMLVLPVPGRFQIGSPDFEKGRDGLEELQEQSITYQFAISAHEVTIDQFQRFRDDPTREHPVGREAERPAVFVTWYDAANYCRWLGEQEDRNRQRCYPAGVNIDSMMEFPNECVMLPGYRLPTGHEWEYAARAGSVTSRYFGNSEEMLKLHSWYGSNSDDRNWPVGCLQPNRWGLFDIYGNATEWCDATMMVMGQTRWQVRGGGYRSTPRYLRSATVDLYPQVSFSYIGFRIAMTLAADDPEVQDRDRAR